MNAHVSPMSLHGARLLDAGFHIIPIAPGKKFPGHYSSGNWSAMGSWSGFSDHKPSEAEFDLWASWPSSGVGIVTGGASGVIGIDIDVLDEAVGRLASIRPRGGFNDEYGRRRGV